MLSSARNNWNIHGRINSFQRTGPPWQGLAIIGVILVAQTFTDFGWKGP